jgi:hypothetical protein
MLLMRQSPPSSVSPLGQPPRRRHPNLALRQYRLWPETGPSIVAAFAPPPPPYAHRRAPRQRPAPPRPRARTCSDRGAPSTASHHRPRPRNSCPHDSMPLAWRPRRPCSRESHDRATRCAHNGPSPAPCNRQSGRSLAACPNTSRHSCPPRRVAPMHSPHADLDQGRIRRPPTIARLPGIRVHMIRRRVPGYRADTALVKATPARPGAHANGPSPAHATARAGAAFRHAPIPRGTAAPPWRAAPMHSPRADFPASGHAALRNTAHPTGVLGTTLAPLAPTAAPITLDPAPIMMAAATLRYTARPAEPRPDHGARLFRSRRRTRMAPTSLGAMSRAAHGSDRLHTCRPCDCWIRPRHCFPAPAHSLPLRPLLRWPGSAPAAIQSPQPRPRGARPGPVPQ